MAEQRAGGEGAEAEPLFEIVSPLVVRVSGQNPSAYTLSGTNTYLVGTGPLRILVDTGDGEQDGYVPALKAALGATGGAGLSAVVVTHWHRDHLGGVGRVKQAFGRDVPVYKYLCPDELERQEKRQQNNERQRSGHDGNGRTSREEDHLFERLEDGQELQCGGATLRFVHTPGHARDHVIAILAEEQSMFTADNVLGKGTTVFEDLGQYLSSLRTMLALQPLSLYPGHGPVVHDTGAGEGQKHIQKYLHHRQKRVDAVLQLLRDRARSQGRTQASRGAAEETQQQPTAGGEPASTAGTADGQVQDAAARDQAAAALTTMEIVGEVYKHDKVPTELLPAAAKNTLPVLRMLVQQGHLETVSADPGENAPFEVQAQMRWRFKQNASL